MVVDTEVLPPFIFQNSWEHKIFRKNENGSFKASGWGLRNKLLYEKKIQYLFQCLEQNNMSAFMIIYVAALR